MSEQERCRAELRDYARTMAIDAIYGLKRNVNARRELTRFREAADALCAAYQTEKDEHERANTT